MISTEKFNEVYAENHRKLYLYARSIVKDEERAKDSVQETFTRLCKQDFEKIEPRLAQWLFVVCRNFSFKQLQKNKRYVELLENDIDKMADERDPSEELDIKEQIKDLQKLVSTLSPREKEVLKYRFSKQLNYQESAKEMKTSEGNVGFLQNNAIKHLRIMMGITIKK